MIAMSERRIVPLALMAGLSVGLAGCGGGDDSKDEASTGQLTLAVTDAPVDEAASVVVGFSGVVLKPAEGPEHTLYFCKDAQSDATFVAGEVCELPAPRYIDLLALQGGASEVLLDSVELPAGHYPWLRLMLTAEGQSNGSYIEFLDGAQHPLHVPSGAQTGLKLVSGFTVPAGGSASFTIDFDLRKSVHKPQAEGKDYYLRPSLRLVDNAEVGSIAGTVAAGLLQDESCTGGNVVYVYSGHDVEPVDLRGEAGDPLSTARVTLNDETGDYGYRAAFLAPGDYTVAFTCQGQNDDPESADEIAFSAPANVTVFADTATVHDFE